MKDDSPSFAGIGGSKRKGDESIFDHNDDGDGPKNPLWRGENGGSENKFGNCGQKRESHSKETTHALAAPITSSAEGRSPAEG